jgi:hypothetical protein
MNPQWNTVLATSNTIPRRSFACSDSAILFNLIFFVNFLSNKLVEVDCRALKIWSTKVLVYLDVNFTNN